MTHLINQSRINIFTKKHIKQQRKIKTSIENKMRKKKPKQSYKRTKEIESETERKC